MAFSQPSAGGDQFDPKDYNGHLVIIYPKSFNAETPTKYGVGPSSDCDIIAVSAVDATGKPAYFQNARLFGNLAKSVSRDLGGQVLGRIGQVPTGNGNPAWVLQPFTDQDAVAATPADTAYRAGQFKQAENPMATGNAPAGQSAPPQAPAQQAWAAQPPAPAAPQPTASAPAPAWNAAATPAAPPQQQWQAPPAAPAAAPPAAPAPAAPEIDPNLIAFLASRGINGPFPDQATAEAIANSLPQ